MHSNHLADSQRLRERLAFPRQWLKQELPQAEDKEWPSLKGYSAPRSCHQKALSPDSRVPPAAGLRPLDRNIPLRQLVPAW
ncbi:MAG TPA: hypothetical protein VFO10_28710 [Oligoflexus sp.]|uniref:hypothetical protein n=1 Tax=Oligoflexus sp. TaxID=1971216 RepID=UPI002D7E1C90|nr:hypothetical protein [Oligoflexus sp.]HET9241281.1 hypothetical protein [Oligoflexus sp.]